MRILLTLLLFLTFCLHQLLSQSQIPIPPLEPPLVYTSKILPVPFFVQPTNNTCQATVMKSFVGYVDSRWDIYSLEQSPSIEDIYLDINSDRAGRPTKGKNSWANICWWLGKYTPTVSYDSRLTNEAETATKALITSIEAGWPVIVSVSHERSAGHIILVVGYQQTIDGLIQFVVHDPYGAFDPALRSALYGQQRYVGGQSLTIGSQSGPGQGIILSIESLRRRSINAHSSGSFAFILSNY